MLIPILRGIWMVPMVLCRIFLTVLVFPSLMPKFATTSAPNNQMVIGWLQRRQGGHATIIIYNNLMSNFQTCSPIEMILSGYVLSRVSLVIILDCGPTYYLIPDWQEHDVICTMVTEDTTVKLTQSQIAKTVNPPTAWVGEATVIAWQMKNSLTGIQPVRPVVMVTQDVTIPNGHYFTL